MPDDTALSQSMTARPGSGPRVAIIGAGLCGLGIGWRLAQAGARVTIFERAAAGRAASWAAAGMLAAQAEAEPGEEMLLALDLESQRRWPAFAKDLEAASGMDLGYRPDGIMNIALTADDEAKLRFVYDYQRDQGLNVSWLRGAEARAREPYLHTRARAAIHSPDDHQVDNRRVVEALRLAYSQAGGALREQNEVVAVEMAGGRATGVTVRVGEDTSHHAADAVLVTAGAWSPTIAGLPDGVDLPVRPLKGQSLALRMDPADPLVRHILWVPGGYLVPRDDGRLIVGATVEEKGFDDTLTAGGVLALLHLAWAAVPGIQELPLDEMWTGFRPSSRDDAPILGRAGAENLFVASGHHRNGVLLLPVTADDMARFILDGRPSAAIEPFALARFGGSSPSDAGEAVPGSVA